MRQRDGHTDALHCIGWPSTGKRTNQT